MQVCNFKVEEKNHYRLVIDNEIDVPDEVELRIIVTWFPFVAFLKLGLRVLEGPNNWFIVYVLEYCLA